MGEQGTPVPRGGACRHAASRGAYEPRGHDSSRHGALQTRRRPTQLNSPQVTSLKVSRAGVETRVNSLGNPAGKRQVPMHRGPDRVGGGKPSGGLPAGSELSTQHGFRGPEWTVRVSSGTFRKHGPVLERSAGPLLRAALPDEPGSGSPVQPNGKQ